MTRKISVGLIGAGAMGGALLRGWLADGAIDVATSAVFDPAANDQIKELTAQHGVQLNPVIGRQKFDAMVVAVKPQMAGDVLPAFAPIADGPVVLSVMAGKSIASVAKSLGPAARIARVMPNLPAAIGKGVTGLYAPETVTADEREMMETLMAAAGAVVWVDSEQAIDFVTAVSGSGPAYFFLLVEALTEAGAKVGLSAEAAAQLARATLSGAGALIEVDERNATEMRRAVTSPGGTTEAALNVFDGDAKELRKLVERAVEAAARRAAELTD